MSHQVVFEIRNIYGRLRAVPKEDIFVDFLEVTGNQSYEGKDIPALKRIVEKLGAEYVEVLKISGKDLPKWEAESRVQQTRYNATKIGLDAMKQIIAEIEK